MNKSLLTLVLVLLFPSHSYACMIVYQPYHMMDKHDLLITAEAGECHAINGTDYFYLSVRRVWKGKDKQNYKIPMSCSNDNPTFLKGKEYMLVANYSDTDDVINIPINKTMMSCQQEVITIIPSIFSHIKIVLEMSRTGTYWWEFLFSSIKPKNLNWGLGEPLYDYRDGFIDKRLLYSYLSFGTLILTFLSAIALMLLIPYYIIKKLKQKLI